VHEHPRRTSGYFKRVCLVTLFSLPSSGIAESAPDQSAEATDETMSVDAIALTLSSPVTRLRSLAWDFNITTYQGDLPEADDQSAYSSLFTLSWPIELSNGKQLSLRATISHYGNQPAWKPVWYLDYADFVIRQLPSIDETTGGFGTGHDHLGAIGFDIGYGGVNESGFVSMFGIANVMPTSEDQSARRGQWLIGPEITLGQVTSWGLFSVRATHLTDIYGDGEQELDDLTTNETSLEVFFSYALGNGWQIESNPVIVYDWEAVSGNEWIVPVGAGVSKTLMLGRMPMKMAIELQKFVVSPDRFGPDWLLRFSLTPVFSGFRVD